MKFKESLAALGNGEALHSIGAATLNRADRRGRSGAFSRGGAGVAGVGVAVGVEIGLGGLGLGGLGLWSGIRRGVGARSLQRIAGRTGRRGRLLLAGAGVVLEHAQPEREQAGDVLGEHAGDHAVGEAVMRHERGDGGAAVAELGAGLGLEHQA